MPACTIGNQLQCTDVFAVSLPTPQPHYPHNAAITSFPLTAWHSTSNISITYRVTACRSNHLPYPPPTSQSCNQLPEPRTAAHARCRDRFAAGRANAAQIGLSSGQCGEAQLGNNCRPHQPGHFTGQGRSIATARHEVLMLLAVAAASAAGSACGGWCREGAGWCREGAGKAGTGKVPGRLVPGSWANGAGSSSSSSSSSSGGGGRRVAVTGRQAVTGTAECL